MNLQRTIISSLVNKKYYILLLFLCYVFPFAYKNFLFPMLRWSTLDYVEVPWIPKDFSKYIVSDGQMELILKHKRTFIWCSYHLTQFCVILQYPQSKSEIWHQKEKPYSVKLHYFFYYFMSDGHILNRLLFMKNCHNEYQQHAIHACSGIHCYQCKCPSNMFLSGIIISSRISLIVFSMDSFVS